MHRLHAISFTIVLLAAAPAAPAQFCLESNQILTGFPNSTLKFVATGDFDGDARADFVVGWEGAFALLRNLGDGTFVRTTQGGQATGLKYLGTGDFDSDGKTDVLSSSGGTAVLYRGLANGTLATPVATGATSSLFCARSADLDGDGRDDALYAALTPALVVQLQSSSGGLLPPVTYPNVGGVIVPGDFDGDGDVDVAMVAGNLVVLMINAGDGTLTQLPAFHLTPMALRDAAGGDLDGDGDADLVIVITPTQPSLVYETRILWNVGPPLFQVSSPLALPTNSRPIAAFVSDLDADGVNDLGVTCENASSVSIWRGLGGGNFAAPTPQYVGGWPQYAAVDDFDGDAKLDLVTVEDWADTTRIAFGRGDATFRDRRQIRLTNLSLASPMTIASADLNGDAYPDIATTIHTANFISVAFNLGNGNFGPHTELTVGWNPFGIVAVDLDGDGDVDLANSNWTRGVSVLSNNGGGVFASPVFYSMAGAISRGLVAADLDADGDQDLIVVAQNSSAIYTLSNLGNGTFATAVPIWITANPLSIAAGDVDLDGDVDLAVGHTLGKVTILRNAGSGDFPLVAVLNMGWANESITLADLDNDALPEIVMAVGDGRLYLSRNLGAGSFAAVTFINVSEQMHEVRCADLDGDGLRDLAAAAGTTIGLSLLKNLGGLTFGPKQEYSAGNWGRSIAVADFDLDGRTDLALASRYELTASILLQCPPPSTAYCFGDGTGSACPCGVSSAGRGCPNSEVSSGARLSTSGIARVSIDSLHLIAEWAPDSTGVVVSGTQSASAPFGDGLLCVGGGIVRLAVVPVIGQRAVLPNHAQPAEVSVLSGASVGSTAHYQFVYRDSAPGFCTSATFNSSNAVITAWAP